MDELIAALDSIERGLAGGDDVESSTIEFKTDSRSMVDTLNNVADAVSCFANALGGVVVVGVDDKTTGATAFTGTDLDAEKTRLRIYEITDPPLLVDAEVIERAERRLLVLQVPNSTQVHRVHKKVPTERVDKHCMPMTADRIAAVVAQKTGQDWSANSSGVPAASVDSLAMDVARGMLRRSTNEGRRRLAEVADIDVLRALGVVVDDQRLTNGGALLFTNSDPNRVLLSYTHRRTPTGQLTANELLTGPLVVAVERTFDLIDARLDTTPVSIGRGQQLHVADLPEPAIREAVINGLMHREYFSAQRTTIEHTMTQLRVSSPGGFVPGVSIDNVLTTSSRTRNTNLASAMRMLGLAETAGSGVDKMYAEMARVGHQPPTYAADAAGVQVTLLGGAPNTALAKYVATLPPAEAADADTMVILLHLLTTRLVDAEALTPILQKATSEEAQSVLTRLSQDNLKLLEPTRETLRRSQPKYRLREEALTALGAAVTYRRRTTDQLDRKVIDLVRETDSINGRMVRILLDLDTIGASRLLADLVERGILVKTSEATRGPGVTYGRGGAFPRNARSGAKRPKPPREGRTQLDGID
ncbi:ATP-binding protein [Schumannella sp. 10F1B-5-1]|uniref:RNA-binding domain-containing protein n=1 Tax=Schumannella sp. 10F1B-5-1 TaxID=2590780 RepID=UPI0011324E48|nr:ATP-binding protein [Schumannella sp. 10F1B-5-1]TPW76764.1 transcriptional regulator [Schumannella sp. 10F1B-5-1]